MYCIFTIVAHTHDMFSTKQRSTWAQWRCVWTKPSFVRTQLCFVQTACAQREAEMCAHTFWLREDTAELCPIVHFRKNTALLRPAHMTAAFSSLRVEEPVVCPASEMPHSAVEISHSKGDFLLHEAWKIAKSALRLLSVPNPEEMAVW